MDLTSLSYAFKSGYNGKVCYVNFFCYVYFSTINIIFKKNNVFFFTINPFYSSYVEILNEILGNMKFLHFIR